MSALKDAILMIKNSWKQVNIILMYTNIVLYIKVTKDTIVNCWGKSGLIDCNETREEVEN